MSASELEFFEHAGHRIACLVHRNDNATRLPVVWLHGLTVSVRFWERAMFQEIRDDRSWFSISMPLHHPSTFEGYIDSEALTEDLFAELLECPISNLIPEGKFHLVGHSIGGFAALNYAAKFPDRVASVVSIGGFMTGRAKGLEGALQFLSSGKRLRKIAFYAAFWILQQHIIVLKAATITYARKWRNLLSYPELDGTLAAVYPDVQQHRICGQRALCRYLLEMDLFDELEAIHQPVLFVIGEKDPVIPVEHQHDCAAALAKAETLVLEGVGHLAFAEQPVEFERAMLAWLARFD